MSRVSTFSYGHYGRRFSFAARRRSRAGARNSGRGLSEAFWKWMAAAS